MTTGKKEVREILAERRGTHGDYTDQAKLTQKAKELFHSSPNWTAGMLRDDQKETIDMTLHKLARLCCGDPDFRDHHDDISGYNTLSADRCTK